MYDRYLLFHESFHFHEDHLTLNQNLFSPVRSSIVTLELGWDRKDGQKQRKNKERQ